MTDDDKKFVREMSAVSKSLNARPTAAETGRLLTLLIEAEGMKEKAEWKREHLSTKPEDKTCLSLCDLSGETNIYDSRHDWSDLDWIAAVRKEIEGD